MVCLTVALLTSEKARSLRISKRLPTCYPRSFRHRHMAWGVQRGKRQLQGAALWVDHTLNGHKSVLGVARLPGIEGLGNRHGRPW
jgi:hypothetical protein